MGNSFFDKIEILPDSPIRLNLKPFFMLKILPSWFKDIEYFGWKYSSTSEFDKALE